MLYHRLIASKIVSKLKAKRIFPTYDHRPDGMNIVLQVILEGQILPDLEKTFDKTSWTELRNL